MKIKVMSSLLGMSALLWAGCESHCCRQCVTEPTFRITNAVNCVTLTIHARYSDDRPVTNFIAALSPDQSPDYPGSNGVAKIFMHAFDHPTTIVVRSGVNAPDPFCARQSVSNLLQDLEFNLVLTNCSGK